MRPADEAHVPERESGTANGSASVQESVRRTARESPGPSADLQARPHGLAYAAVVMMTFIADDDARGWLR